MNDALPVLHSHLLLMARYNAWATQRLYEHVDELDDADYRRNVGLFFKSIHGTLNHLLVGEHHLWYARFVGGESPQVQLDAEVETDRAALREELTAGAARWSEWLERLDARRLAGTLDYRTTRGEPVSLPFAATLMHVFNHGTHHRGQISAGLTVLGQRGPVIDLVFMLQQEATRR